jgi:hypothetical protein
MSSRYPVGSRIETVSRPAWGYREAVTDRNATPIDDHVALEAARRAARYAVRAAEDLATFAERAPAVLSPALRAEYAALLGRDEEARGQRQDAFDVLGLSVPSLAEQEVEIP